MHRQCGADDGLGETASYRHILVVLLRLSCVLLRLSFARFFIFSEGSVYPCSGFFGVCKSLSFYAFLLSFYAFLLSFYAFLLSLCFAVFLEIFRRTQLYFCRSEMCFVHFCLVRWT